MEEDIKILEEQLNIYKRHLENYEKEECLTSVYYELKKYAQALENLLTRYKEIKTEHKIMKRILVEHNLWETLLNDDEFIKHLEEE